MKNRNSPIWKIPKTDLENIVKNSTSIVSILRFFNLTNKGHNYRTLKKRLAEDNIDYSHINLGYTSNKNRTFKKQNKLSNEEIFIENSSYHRTHLKTRICKQNLIEYKCSECNLGNTWNNKNISLQLDHINGIHNDNRLENLRFLCPNCHSQTNTFAGRRTKGIKKVLKIKAKCLDCGVDCYKHGSRCRKCAGKKLYRFEISKNDLENLTKIYSLEEIGRQLGVSGVAIKKRCVLYGIKL